MGNRRGKFGGGGDSGIGDLETLRERVLDHPDEEDEVAGISNDNSSTAETGPIKVLVRPEVIIKQDGIGRTGGIVLGVVSGLALGLAGMTLAMMVMRDDDQRAAADKRHAEVMEQMRKTETEARMVQYYLQDPSFRTKAELEEWARFKGKE